MQTFVRLDATFNATHMKNEAFKDDISAYLNAFIEMMFKTG